MRECADNTLFYYSTLASCLHQAFELKFFFFGDNQAMNFLVLVADGNIVYTRKERVWQHLLCTGIWHSAVFPLNFCSVKVVGKKKVVEVGHPEPYLITGNDVWHSTCWSLDYLSPLDVWSKNKITPCLLSELLESSRKFLQREFHLTIVCMQEQDMKSNTMSENKDII